MYSLHPYSHLAPFPLAVLPSTLDLSIHSKLALMTTPKLLSTRPNAAVASAAAEGIDAPKANVDDAASSSAVAEEGVPEDSDADPEADALAIGHQGLLSGSMEDGATKDKNADRPWIKNVRNNPY